MKDAPLKKLLKEPMFIQWALAALIIRLPGTMNLLSMVLIGEHITGDVANGAILAGIAAFSAGLSARYRGQQLDRTILRNGLMSHSIQTGVAQLIMAGLAFYDVSFFWFVPVAMAIGVLGSAVAGGLRALLVPSVPEELVEQASALDAVLIEVAFVSGPALAGILALMMPSPTVMLLQAVLLFAGALLLARLPKMEPNNIARLKGKNPLFIKGATPIYAILTLFGLTFGIYDGIIAKIVMSFGWDAASAGPVGAAISFGSAMSGFVAANVTGVLRIGRPLAGILMAFLGLAFLAPGLSSHPWVFVGLLFFTGLPIAPLMTLGTMSLQNIVPKRQHSEAFSLYGAIIMVAAGFSVFVTGLFMRTFPEIPAQTIWYFIPLLPFLGSIIIFSNVVIRRRQGKPQGIGYPLDPDIPNPNSGENKA